MKALNTLNYYNDPIAKKRSFSLSPLRIGHNNYYYKWLKNLYLLMKISGFFLVKFYVVAA